MDYISWNQHQEADNNIGSPCQDDSSSQPHLAHDLWREVVLECLLKLYLFLNVFYPSHYDIRVKYKHVVGRTPS